MDSRAKPQTLTALELAMRFEFIKETTESEYFHGSATTFYASGYVSCPMNSHGGYQPITRMRIVPVDEATHVRIPNGDELSLPLGFTKWAVKNDIGRTLSPSIVRQWMIEGKKGVPSILKDAAKDA